MKIVDSILELIGNTPMLRLHKVTEGLEANVLVKLEYLNPSGSYKDRIALRMIEDAEKTGRIKPGYTIVESSSGNTAIAVSFVGGVKGYKVRIYYPEDVWVEEKRKILTRFGAEIEMTPLVETEVAREAGVHGARVEIPGRVKSDLLPTLKGRGFRGRPYSRRSHLGGISAPLASISFCMRLPKCPGRPVPWREYHSCASARATCPKRTTGTSSQFSMSPQRGTTSPTEIARSLSLPPTVRTIPSTYGGLNECV